MKNEKCCQFEEIETCHPHCGENSSICTVPGLVINSLEEWESKEKYTVELEKDLYLFLTVFKNQANTEELRDVYRRRSGLFMSGPSKWFEPNN